MSIDLSSVKCDTPDPFTFRAGVDAEKVASLLDNMAAAIRNGIVIPQQAKLSSIFTSGEWETGELVLTFNEKVET